MHIKNAISRSVTSDKISILEINSHLLTLSQNVMAELNNKIAANGIKITYFTLENVTIPENDPSVIKLKESLSKRADMDIVGYTYKEERSFDVMDSFAANNGGGNSGLAGTIIGAGVGLGLAGTAAQTMQNMAQPISETVNPKPSEMKTCPQCNTQVPIKSKFCSECGYAFPQKKFCANCGTESSATAKFCSECGVKL